MCSLYVSFIENHIVYLSYVIHLLFKIYFEQNANFSNLYFPLVSIQGVSVHLKMHILKITSSKNFSFILHILSKIHLLS